MCFCRVTKDDWDYFERTHTSNLKVWAFNRVLSLDFLVLLLIGCAYRYPCPGGQPGLPSHEAWLPAQKIGQQLSINLFFSCAKGWSYFTLLLYSLVQLFRILDSRILTQYITTMRMLYVTRLIFNAGFTLLTIKS